ncbi:uncharacterized protein LOC132539103 [Erinaceus europaeus]|uniref:Uncharacterized protein LOC132539103 n=1 Tax=Erinaceus europaeus TaxID=9365 RepID=A0ABM3XKE9_ERIEU|nr:uncharacterized protein LOC132539103 [Erinaceus europaeus]
MHLSQSMDRAVVEAAERTARVLETLRRAEANRTSVQGLGSKGTTCSTYSPSTHSATSIPSLTDSEWQTFNAYNKSAWIKHTQDPWISSGFLDSVDMKIEPLGSNHCLPSKSLGATELQVDEESLQGLQGKGSNLQSGKRNIFYDQKQQWQQRLDAYRLKQQRRLQRLEDTFRCYNIDPNYAIPREKGRRPLPRLRTEEAERWESKIPERELSHIQRHIHRTERARGLRDKCQLVALDIPSEVGLPKKAAAEKKEVTITDEQMAIRRINSKRQMAKVTEQIKEHQDRMLRGRRLTEQRRAEKEASRIPSQILPLRTQLRGRRTFQDSR